MPSSKPHQADSNRVRSGGCLCGGVRYRVYGELCAVVNCFCGQCRKTSGHYFAATRVSLGQFELQTDQTLRWYPSSEYAQRGFCHRCGGNLFWQAHNRDTISITAGSLDKPSGLKTAENIYVEDASDYYAIPTLPA